MGQDIFLSIESSYLVNYQLTIVMSFKFCRLTGILQFLDVNFKILFVPIHHNEY